MPLDYLEVETGRSPVGDAVVFCRHCHRQADYARTVVSNNQLVYQLLCPTSVRTLGTWDTDARREAEIRAFLQTATLQE